MQNNGTFYLYAYVVKSGKPLDRKATNFDPDSVAVKQHGELLRHSPTYQPSTPLQTFASSNIILCIKHPAPDHALDVPHRLASAPSSSASTTHV